MSDEEKLVTRRSRRSTAGNRMQAALAEMSVENTARDLDDDVEFIIVKEEEDVFESDFESTDEDTAQAEAATDEKEVQDEERRVRKQAKSKLEKVTAAADARLRITFNPDTTSGDKLSQKYKQRRRVSLGPTINAETGEVIGTDGIEEGSTAPSQTKTRHSRRSHTVKNTVETVKRLKSSEEKRAAAPKKAKITKKLLTQDELIARALDNEEGNIVEHRDYLRLEEEKRKRARVTKTAIAGPLVRWISRREEVKVTIQPPAPAPPSLPTASYPNFAGPAVGYPYSFSYPPGTKYADYLRFYQTYTQGFNAKVTQAQPVPPAREASSALASTSTNPAVTAVTQSTAIDPLLEQPQSIEKTEIVSKNYVVHELGQYDGIRKANWTETMKAMFGDHVRWDEVKVYVGKGRPMSRPKPICPITGKQAVYLDPRTGVPYADAGAFKVLTGLLKHEFVWNAELGCYVGTEENADSPADVDMTE